MKTLIERGIGFIIGIAIVYFVLYIVKLFKQPAIDISGKYGNPNEILPMEKRIVCKFILFKKLKNTVACLVHVHVLEQYRLTKEGTRKWKAIRFIDINDLEAEDRMVDLYNRKQYYRNYWKKKDKSEWDQATGIRATRIENTVCTDDRRNTHDEPINPDIVKSLIEKSNSMNKPSLTKSVCEVCEKPLNAEEATMEVCTECWRDLNA